MDLNKAFTLIEPGPVVLITTNDGEKNNIMTLSWSMVLDFTPKIAKALKEFKEFELTPQKAKNVHAPLIKECMANIECKFVDIIKKRDIIILEGVAAYYNSSRKNKQMLHAVGDGTFVVDGRKINRKKVTQSKLADIY